MKKNPEKRQKLERSETCKLKEGASSDRVRSSSYLGGGNV